MNRNFESEGNKMKSTLIRLGLMAVMISALASCGGNDGAPGAPGATGAPGAPGGMIVASNLTDAQWAALTPTIDPASISITINSPPVVKFRVTDANGNPLVGLGTKDSNGRLSNIYFTLAKLVPVTGGPSVWRSYLVTKPSTSSTAGAVKDSNGAYWLGTYPTQEREGTMIDNGDGTYQYTFARDIKQAATIVTALTDDATHVKADLGDVSYNPSATTRLAIVIKGTQPGGTAAIALPANVTYDFRPDGGAITATRDIVQRGSCDDCHSGKIIGHGDRRDPKLCVTCHTDQAKYGFVNVVEGTNPDGSPALTTSYMRTTTGEAAFTYPRMIHQTHMGEELVKTGYNLNGHCNYPGYPGYDAAKPDSHLAQCLNTVRFPQSQTDCTKCHDGNEKKSDGTTNVNWTKDGNNWNLVPSRLACGACHDGIDFATGTGITLADKAADIAAGNPVGTTQSGHGVPSFRPGPQTNDSLCSGCHNPTQIQTAHRYTVSTLNNPVVQAGVSSFSYGLSKVTLDSSRNPVFTFKITKDGTAVTTLGTPTAQIAGFTGGPSLYIAYAVPQDGIAAPADFNVTANAKLQNIMDGTKGTLLSTTADSNGYFTATLNSPVPTNATIVTGAIIGHYTQTGLTDYPAGLNIKTMLVLRTATGFSPRRAIVAAAKCDSCHEQLGTSPEFHGGDRNDPQACNICHNGNRTSSGWSADSSTYIHGIHGASKRSIPFTWHAVSATDDYSMLKFPGVLKNCNQCHLPDTVNFSNTGGATVAPNLLWSTTAAGIYNSTVGTTTNGCTVSVYNTCIATDASVHALSPYIIADNTTDYGAVFSYSFNASGVIATTPADPKTLVNSPIASACFACHDTSLAKLHIEGNGGAIYETRASQSDTNGNLINREQCLVCHGKGRVADVAAVHQ